MIDAGQEYVVLCDVPGARSEALELTPGPLPGTLSIRVPLKDASLNGHAIRAERSAAKRFARIVPVGFDADVEHARGSIESGVLRISVPRRER